MDELPDWSVPVYQSLTQPQLQGGVAAGLLYYGRDGGGRRGAVVVAHHPRWRALYLAAWIGTRYDPHFFEIILAHVQQHDHYEG